MRAANAVLSLVVLATLVGLAWSQPVIWDVNPKQLNTNANTPITLTGYNFGTNPTAIVVTITDGTTSLPCASPTRVGTPVTIVCTLPIFQGSPQILLTVGGTAQLQLPRFDQVCSVARLVC